MTTNDKGVALVIGASGFFGTRLIRHLTRTGKFAAVRAVDFRAPRERHDGVEYRQHDVRQPLPDDLGRGVSVIYNFAAVHRTPGHEPHEYYETNLAGSLHAVALAERCGVETIVFTSSISVYGPSEDRITEQSEPRPVSDYGRSKLLCEKINALWAERSPSRRLIVVRPGVIFGPGEDGNYTTLIGALKRRMFFYPGRKGAIKSSGFVDDLILAIEFVRGLGRPKVTFNYAFPHQSTTEEIVQAATRTAGIRFNPPVIPAFLLMMAALPFEALDKLGFRNRIHRDRVRKLIMSTHVHPEFLVAEGYPFSADLASALEAWNQETGGKFV